MTTNMHNRIAAALLLAGSFLLLNGCGVETADTFGVHGKKFHARSQVVKSSLAEDGHSVVWSQDDKISVWDGTRNNCFTVDASTIDGGSASFVGDVSGEATRFVALYPYSDKASFDDLSITVKLPANQNAVAGGYDPECAFCAAVTEDETLQFHHLVSLFKITLSKDQTDVKKITVKGNNQERLAGAFTAVMDLSGLKSVFVKNTATDAVSVSGDLPAGKSFYLAVPGNIRFSRGITVSLELDGGITASKSITSSIDLGAGLIYGVDMSGAPQNHPFGGDVLSFNKGDNLTFTLNAYSEVKLASGQPSGWNVSITSANKVSITAPSSIEGPALSGKVSFACRESSGTERVITVQLRLYGINSLQDFKDFRDAAAEGGDVNPYLSGGKAVLNCDVSIGNSDMLEGGTFMYSMAYPFEGNGKTVTLNTSASKRMNSLFGYLRANVSNLNIAGSISTSNTTCIIAPLAYYCGPYQNRTATITISNVTSSANVSYRASSGTTSSQIAGLVAICGSANATVNFSNCKVTGKIKTSQSILDTGGFVCRTESGTPGVKLNFTDCEFAGEIEYNQTAVHPNPRVGGFVASGERRTSYTRCKNSGKITANLNNTVFDPDGGGGLGGILGRSSKVVSGYNMGWYLNNVTTNCIITINGQPANATTAYFGKIIGSKQDEAKQYDEVTEGGSLTINTY